MASFFDYNEQLGKHSVSLAKLETLIESSNLLAAEVAADLIQHILKAVSAEIERVDTPDFLGAEGDDWASL